MEQYQDKVIFNMYKKFYGKDPDLSSTNIKNITIEIQSMFLIIQEYSCLLNKTSFTYGAFKDLNLPFDLELQDVIVRQLIDNDISYDMLQFSDYVEMVISLIGTSVRTIINGSKNSIESLRQISCVLFIKKYVKLSSVDEELKEIFGLDLDALTLEKNLNEMIKVELGKDNYNDNNLDYIKHNLEDECIPAKVYRPVINYGGPTKVFVNKKSREICAKALLN